MKVRLKNVGMLDETEFEVGGLTIICGENNTGKTYATYSLYGYLDFVRTIRESLFYRYKGTMLEENDEYKQEIKVTMKHFLNSSFMHKSADMT